MECDKARSGDVTLVKKKGRGQARNFYKDLQSPPMPLLVQMELPPRLFFDCVRNYSVHETNA